MPCRSRSQHGPSGTLALLDCLDFPEGIDSITGHSKLLQTHRSKLFIPQFQGQHAQTAEERGHEGTVVGVITQLPQGTTLASRGQAGAAQDPEEV